MMTRDEVIRHLCETVDIIYKSRGDYSQASDCFCSPKHDSGFSLFEHSGYTVRYLRHAVVEKLRHDGYKVADLGGVK